LDPFGLWRSLVARSVRVGEVAGSNPVSPIFSRSLRSRARAGKPHSYAQDAETKAAAEAAGRAASRTFDEGFFALEPYRDQLAVRLGAKHDLTVAFETLFEDLSSVGQVMGKVSWPATSEHEQWIANTKWAYRGRRDEFFETAARFVGTQVSE
jgi:hypothetical protein